jgi:ABC-type antimicrobial peptide transport system permease subunit
MTESNDPGFDSTPPEGSGNRTFFTTAGILGGIVLLSIICLAAYAFFYLPGQRAQQTAQQATLSAQNTQVVEALTGTAMVSAMTEQASHPTETPTPSPTPVVAQATPTSATPGPATATVAAALTQAAIAAQTALPTSTALPGTGFADEIGVPGLLAMAVILIAVILLARRLRASSTKS